MNKIIKGKRYDTATAQRICEIETSLGRSEEMFRKRTGEFFVVRWTRWDGEESRIKPVTYEYAQKWCEENLDGDEYEKIFGLMEEETGEKQTVSMSLDKGIIEKLKRISVEKGISVSEYVSNLVKNA
jgi:hypothetical protein